MAVEANPLPVHTFSVTVFQGLYPQLRAHLAATPEPVQANANFAREASLDQSLGSSGMAIAVAWP